MNGDSDIANVISKQKKTQFVPSLYQRQLVLILITIVTILCGTKAIADSLILQGKDSGDYARVMFAPNNPLEYSVKMRRNVIALQLSDAFEIRYTQVKLALADHITKIKISPDSTQVFFTLSSDKYQLKKFTSNGIYGFDLIKSVEKLSKQTFSVNTNGKNTDDTRNAKRTATAIDKVIEIAKKRTEVDNKKIIASQATEELDKIDLPAKLEESKISPLITSDAIIDGQNSDNERSDEFYGLDLPPPTDMSKLDKQPAAKRKPSHHERMRLKKLSGKQAQNSIHVQFREHDEFNTMIFPWGQKNIGAAIFERAGVLWVIFDTKSPMNLDEIEDADPNTIKSLDDNLNVKRSSLLRFKGDFKNLVAYKRNNSWVVSFGKQKDPKAKQSKASIPKYSNRNKSNMTVPVKNFSKYIKIIDPYIGDDLIINLVSNMHHIQQTYNFVDFDLAQTAQGVAILVKNDKTAIKYGSSIEITMPSGHAHMKSRKPVYARHANLDELIVAQPKSMFLFNDWKQVDNSDFVKKKHQILKAISTVPKNQRNIYRQELAQFYFAQGLHKEAATVIEQIKRTGSYLTESTEFKFFEAANQYLDKRYAKAQDTLESIKDDKLSSNQLKEEIKFWLIAAKIKSDRRINKKLMLDYNKYADYFITSYPKDIKNDFILTAAERYLSLNKTSQASNLIRKVKFNKDKDKSLINTINFFRGQIAAKQNRGRAAIEIWKRITADPYDRRNRARAKYAYLSEQYRQGDISQKEMIKELNNLLVVWRGDNIELQILKDIGQIYYDTEQYEKSFQVWREAITYFPNNRESLYITRKMADKFVELFTTDKLGGLSELDALALYYEFKALTPIGTMGDKVIQNLADRMLNADLLDRAAALLTHQVKFRIKGVERSQVGAKLAKTYIMNNKQGKALEALKVTKNALEPEILRQNRAMLKAKAYSGLKKHREALLALKRNTGYESDILRAEIYWNWKKWKGVAKVLEPIFALEDGRPPLKQEEVVIILRLATSYSILNEREKLQGLWRNYHDLIETSDKNKEIFRFLVNTSDHVDFNNFTESIHFDEMKNFLDHYSKKYYQ